MAGRQAGAGSAVHQDPGGTAGDEIDFSVWAKWQGLAVTDGEAGMTLGAVAYSGDERGRAGDLSARSTSPTGRRTPTAPTCPRCRQRLRRGDRQLDRSRRRRRASGCGWRSPRRRTSGAVWFDLVTHEGRQLLRRARVYKKFQTMSDFAKACVEFRDSGLIRSRLDVGRHQPGLPSIEDTKLAYYIKTIPPRDPRRHVVRRVQGVGRRRRRSGAPRSRSSRSRSTATGATRASG